MSALLVAGLLGFFLPEVLGGGNSLIVEASVGRMGLRMIILLILVKLFFTALSYGSGSPGGIIFHY